MPKTIPIQESFAAGEISPRFISQINSEPYKKGLKDMINWIPMPQGPFYRRNGSWFMGSVPGTYGRVFGFPITRSFAAVSIVTDENKMYIATPDGFELDSNRVTNPRFLQGSTGWTDISQGSGYVIFSAGSATLAPGSTHPSQDRTAGIRQQITLTTPANDQHFHISMAPNAIQAEVRITLGNNAGGNEYLDVTLSPDVIDYDITFNSSGDASVWLDIVAQQNNEGAVRIINSVEIYDPLSTSKLEFTTPWSSSELDLIQVGYPPGEDTIYFVGPSDPIYELKFDRATETFTFGASPIVSPPAQWVAGNYPRSITFFQGRMWVGGTPDQPEMFWASKSGNYLDFTTGTGAADALSFTMAKKGAIQWMAGAKNLLIGTEFGEYIVTSEGGVVTGQDINVDQQSAYGSAPIQPVQIGNRVLYVSPDRRKIRDMGYKWTDDGWVSRDITFTSEHITVGNTIKDLTFAQNPASILSCITQTNHTVAGVYERGNDIVGWFRAETDGQFMATTSVDLEGTSALVMLFNRNIEATPTLYLEVYYPSPARGGRAPVDSAEVVGGDVSSLDSISSVSVPHLKNKTVNVIVDGAVHPDITLDDNGNGDLQFPGTTVIVGLGFNAVARLLPLASTLQIGQSTLPAMKRYNQVYVRIFDSAYPKINGTRPPSRQPTDLMDMREPNETGDIKVTNLGWSRGAEITIEQDLPLQTQIAGVFGEAAQEMLGT